MANFPCLSRARRALICAALAGLGLATGAPAIAQEVKVEVEVEEGQEPQSLLMKSMAGTRVGDALIAKGLRIDGYVQASWHHAFDQPDDDVITGRGLDFEHDDPTLNGIGLSFHRDIEATPDKFDIGFGLDLLYGADARFTKSNGLLDYQGFVFDGTGDGPNNQFDITQAFVTFGVPVGQGVLITAGKFITPIGYEYVDPRKNTLYSHSYLFNFGAPFSHTGVMGKYQLSDDLAISAGFARGWDQSLEDSNDRLEALGVVEWAPEDSEWSWTLSLATGPQDPDSDGWRTTLDLLVTYEMSEDWRFGMEALYGIEADVPGTDDDFSQWYGVAVYPTYQVCPGFSLNGRAEWFSDGDGVRGVGTDHVFEVTLGCTIEPLIKTSLGSALRIRPEIRWDYAPDDDLFDGGTANDQVTFAIDAVFAF